MQNNLQKVRSIPANCSKLAKRKMGQLWDNFHETFSGLQLTITTPKAKKTASIKTRQIYSIQHTYFTYSNVYICLMM